MAGGDLEAGTGRRPLDPRAQAVGMGSLGACPWAARLEALLRQLLSAPGRSRKRAQPRVLRRSRLCGACWPVLQRLQPLT